MTIHEKIIFIHMFMLTHKHIHRHIYKYIFTGILTRLPWMKENRLPTLCKYVSYFQPVIEIRSWKIIIMETRF